MNKLFSVRNTAVALSVAVALAFSTAQSRAAPSGTVTIGFDRIGTEERWLPWLGGIPDHMVMSAVYEYLLGRAPGTDNLVPRLAERFEWSSDNKTLTFFLRKGVAFHDGWGEMTADDVKFSFDRYLATPRAPSLAYFKNTIDSVVVVDPYTVELRLKKVDWALPSQLSNSVSKVAIVSKKYVEEVGEDRASLEPIGTGPFTFVEAERRSFVKLEAVENHWRKTPEMQTLILRRISEAGTRLAALRSGDVDIIDVLYEHVPELEDRGFKIIPIRSVKAVHVAFGGMNTPGSENYDANVPWVGPTEERARTVRRALALAVDRQTIIDTIYAGQGENVAVPGFIPGRPWTDPTVQPYPYDPAKARELLAQAGYPDGFPVKILALAPFYGGTEIPQVAEAVANYWTRVGLDVEIVPMEWATFRPKLLKRDTVGITWVHGLSSFVSPEPAVVLRNLWTCDGVYIILACNDTVDASLKAILEELDEDKRVELRRNVFRAVYDNYLFVPIGQVNVTLAANPDRIAAWPLVPGTADRTNYEYMELAD